MEAYLDNSATTKAGKNVIDIVTKVMSEDFGNPSSKHMKGVEAESYLRQSREVIAGVLHVNEKEIVFTSGGTESNNMAIIGTAMANLRSGRHIITTCIEHESVKEPLRFLEEMKLSDEYLDEKNSEGIDPDKKGFDVTYLSVDGRGHINLEELSKAIRKDTILVSIMFVNNEMGAVQDIEKIGRLIKEKNPKTVFHADAIQAFGKYEINPKKMGIDLLSVSGHKFHGPKGVGFLYISEKVKINPYIYGGGQQKGRRSGTDNVPGVAGIGVAAKEAYENFGGKIDYLYGLKDYFVNGLRDLSEMTDSDGCEESVKLNLKINSDYGRTSAPHIVSVTFKDVKSEVLLHALEDKGIYVSSGSACSSNRKNVSSTLVNIGLSDREADSTLRFSFCDTTTKEELEYCLEMLKQLVPVLSKFTSK